MSEAKLRAALAEYMRLYPAFRCKPLGAPHSEKRQEQDAAIALEDRARKLLKDHAHD